MAIKFQYNKTALNNLNKQLKMRKNALPTLQNKESALRLDATTTWPPCGTNSIRGSSPSPA